MNINAMKNIKNILRLNTVVLLMLAAHVALAQQSLREKIVKAGESTSVFDKKFHMGASLNIYWATISGDKVSDTYFAKPSLGGSIRAEYYFTPFLGIGIGAGYQQRGAGIKNVDVSGGAFAHPWITNDLGEVGNPDSTYLERLRFNSLEFPVTILLRTPKDVFEGMRLSASVGPTLIHTMSVNLTMQSIIDGFHPYNWVTDNYIRNDIGWQASVGADIDSGGGKSLCQVHFVYTSGTRNVYAQNQGDGRQVTYGVRLSWLF